MPLSPRPQRPAGAPRDNHYIESFAFQAEHAGLIGLARELRGRPVLTADDITVIESRIAAGHAALDRLSIEITHNRPALLAEGADNSFMGRHLENGGQS